MLTPLEIQKIEFKKTLGRYAATEVDETFSVICADYESIYKENIKLKDKISVLENLVEKYKAIEDTLRETLVVAQKAADDLSKSAAQKAEAIVAQAENEALLIKEGAKAKAADALDDAERVKSEIISYSIEIDSILDAQKKIVAKILNSRSDNDGLRSDAESAENRLPDEGEPSGEGAGDTE